MEKLRYEVYLEGNNGDTTRMDIYSHIKQEWIFNDQVRTNDVFVILEQRTIKKEGTLIHIPDSHLLFNAFSSTKWVTKYFNGLSGQYLLTDGSVYELSYRIPPRPPKKTRELVAKCIKSQTKTDQVIIVDEKNINRNLRHNLWIKQ